MTLPLLQLQLLVAIAPALSWILANPAEAVATATGLAGAYLLASRTRWAPLGWLSFLASNAAWLYFAWQKDHPGLFLQQVGFTGSSLLGIWQWIVRPRLQWKEWRGSFDGRPTMWIMPLLRWRGRRIDLHKMVAADDEECFHSHPARAIRIVLWSGYVEEILHWQIDTGVFRAWQIETRRRRPGYVNLVRPELTHRIASLPRGVSYSLWIRGRKTHPTHLVGSGWPEGAKAAP